MPNVAGKNRGLIYDTVKEHILQDLQKNLNNGSDIVDSLWKGVDAGIRDPKPLRKMAIKKEMAEKEKPEPPIVDTMKEEQRTRGLRYGMPN